MGRGRELVQNLALSVATVLIVVGGAEIVCRRRERGAGPRAVATNIQDWQDWRGDFYTLRSTVVGTPPFEDYNHEGLRDREHSTDKPPGARRVVCLGDSTTFGWGIRPEEAYPQSLQDLLDAAGEPAEVFNLALPGWSTRQEAIAYRQIARRYAPDQVLLGVCLNDVAELQNNLSRPSALLAPLYRRSALVRRVVRAKAREIAEVEELFTHPDAPRVRAGFERLFEETRRLRDDVHRDGATLAVLVFPFADQVRAGARAPRPQEEIARFCREEGIPFLDLLPALRAEGPSAFLDEDHFTPEGARRVAETVHRSGLVLGSEGGGLEAAPAAIAGDGPRAAGIVSGLRSRDPGERAAAARSLAALGASASGLGDLVAAALDDDVASVRAAAAWAAGAIGGPPYAVPRLLGLLQRGGPPERAAAAAALGRIPSTDLTVSTALTEALDDPEGAVRWRAGVALARRRPGPEALPPLVRLLEQPSGRARGAAAEVVGRIGPAASSAVPALLHALDDPRDDVRWHAVWAAGQIGPAAAAAVPRLVSLLSDPAVRWRAADALGSIGPAAASAVPALVAALDDPSDTVRWRVARALGGIGPAAEGAADALTARLDDRGDDVRLAAVHSLGDVGGDPLALVAAMEHALADRDRRVRHEATNVLGRLGPRGQASGRALLALLRDEDAGVRAGAARALGRIGIPRSERTALESLRNDPDERVREAAARALEKLPPP